MFDALSASVESNGRLPCSYELPEPPEDVELDWDAVNFVYTAEGADEERVIPYVGGDGACDDEQGWYYDDRGDPTAVLVCPATCDALIEGAGHVEIAFGCATLLL